MSGNSNRFIHRCRTPTKQSRLANAPLWYKLLLRDESRTRTVSPCPRVTPLVARRTTTGRTSLSGLGPQILRATPDSAEAPPWLDLHGGAFGATHFPCRGPASPHAARFGHSGRTRRPLRLGGPTLGYQHPSGVDLGAIPGHWRPADGKNMLVALGRKRSLVRDRGSAPADAPRDPAFR
jgi:hypothetical protein